MSEDHFAIGHLREQLASRSARGGAVTLAAQWSKFVIWIASTVILARLLTPEDYGLLGMVTVLTGFIAIFKDVGLSAATVQRPAITQTQVSTLFWLNVALGICTMLIVCAAAPGLAALYREPRVEGIAIGLALTFGINGFAVQHQALLQRQMRFGALAVIDIVTTILTALVAIATALSGKGYWSLVCGQLVTSVAAVAGVWLVCSWRPSATVSIGGVRSIVTFGTNLTGFHVLNYFARHLDNALIGRYWGSVQLGLYDKAYQMLLLPIGQINGPITAVALPSLSRLVLEPDAYRRSYRRILEKIVLVTMPGAMLMVLTSDWIVEIVLGPQWRGVAVIFSLLGLSAPAIAICDTTGWLFVSQGRTNAMFRWGLVGGPLIVVGILLGLKWGAVGVAAAYSATTVLVVAPLLFWVVTREGPVRQSDFYATIASIAAPTVVMTAALGVLKFWLRDASPYVGLPAMSIAALCIFAASLCSFERGRLIVRDVWRMRELLVMEDVDTTKP